MFYCMIKAYLFNKEREREGLSTIADSFSGFPPTTFASGKGRDKDRHVF